MTKSKAYQAALRNAAYYPQPQAGFLRMTERDRVDFLQRQTTNDLRQLSADRVVSTVLTSPTARIIDVFSIIDEDEALGVVSLPGRAAETSKFLRSRIFFTDKVRVENISAEVAQILLVGPQTERVLEHLGLEMPAPNQIIRWEIVDQFVTVMEQKNLMDTGYRFIVPVTALDAMISALEATSAVSIDPETFDILRVESGQPGSVGELVDAYTPLEVGLGDFISDSKGCYTGQEIIARQITYDKVAKILVGIKLNGLVTVGAEIKDDGKSAGILTSIVESPRFGPIGLAVVRRQNAETGTRFSVLGSDDSVVSGEIVSLPFSRT